MAGLHLLKDSFGRKVCVRVLVQEKQNLQNVHSTNFVQEKFSCPLVNF